MKNSIILIIVILFVCSCNNKQKDAASPIKNKETYLSLGNKIDNKNITTLNYQELKPGDTLNTKLEGTIKEVCTKKGCWMTVALNNNETVMVKFKDYGFFMPLDANGEVIIKGKAFVSETSVEDLKHYAEDEGKSKEEIAAITTPKLEYKFEAEGVLLKN